MNIAPIYNAYAVLVLLWFSGLIVTTIEIRWPRLSHLPMFFALLSVAVALTLSVLAWQEGFSVKFAGGGLVLDGFSVFIQVFVLATVAFSLLMVHRSKEGQKPSRIGLMLLSASGFVLVGMSMDFIALLAGLTVSVMPLLGIAAVAGSEQGREAALKGLLLYAIAACILGLGAALMASRAGTTTFVGIGDYLGEVDWIGKEPLAVVAIALVLSGLALFLSVVPFHMLSMDLAEGLPSPASLLFTGGLIAAGLAAFSRVLWVALGHVGVSGPGYLSWIHVLRTAGIIALLVGNSMALVQKRLKRLIACLLSGQVGLVLVAMAASGSLLVAHPEAANRAAGAILVFLGILAVNWAGLFLAVAVAERADAKATVGTLQGLSRKHPWLATAIGLSLLCMAGMPLTAGFFSRLYLMESILSAGWVATAVIVALSLGVVLVMSLGLVVAMFMRPSMEGVEITVPLPLTITAWLVSMSILIVGVWPSGMVDIALSSTALVLGY